MNITTTTTNSPRDSDPVSVESAVLVGVDSWPVHVEVHVSGRSFPGFHLVGQPDPTVRELRDRVRAAVLSSGLHWPTGRVTVNVAPPGLRRLGASLDLPIALAVLAGDGQIEPADLKDTAFLGELGLDGSLRPPVGVFPLVEAIDSATVVVPAVAGPEAALAAAGRRTVRVASDLHAVLAAVSGDRPWPAAIDCPRDGQSSRVPVPLQGGRVARFALEVAAAGEHHLLLAGSPAVAVGRQLVHLLPDLAGGPSVEVARVHSAAGWPVPSRGVVRPPLRSVEPGTSAVALIGGGRSLCPGELSLAHRGVLLLEDMAEVSRAVLDSLHQPLDEGCVRVCRGTLRATFPARFLLVATTSGSGERRDGLQPDFRGEIQRLGLRRVPGPLLDRFDMWVDLTRPDDTDTGESTLLVAGRVCAARERAAARGVDANSDLSDDALNDLAPFDDAATGLVHEALWAGRLTGRGVDAVRRVALTIADLAGDRPPLLPRHVSPALALRTMQDPFSRRFAHPAP